MMEHYTELDGMKHYKRLPRILKHYPDKVFGHPYWRLLPEPLVLNRVWYRVMAAMVDHKPWRQVL